MIIDVPRPRLLVSVRDVTEARAAITGGADIIDVKEPSAGSLGRPNAAVLQEIADFASQERALPLSVALGEVTDDDTQDSPLPPNVTFAKLGLSKLGRDPQWVERWCERRQQVEDDGGIALRWVAVIYADESMALSPPTAEIVAAAQQTGCAGVLIDTFDKSTGRLFDHVPPAQLSKLANSVRQREMFFAVAGRLRITDISSLVDTGADIIAVRSAACEGDDRTARVTIERVQECKKALGDSC